MTAPNPIFERSNYRYFNEGWMFSIDGKEYKKINVPYCPQSILSGIHHTGFIRSCHYKKVFDFSFSETKGLNTFICFGAVDYKCEVYLNGNFAGTHTGGYTPFSFDITPYLFEGENEIYLSVQDDCFTSAPTGKQSRKESSFGCFYTRTTGIWQSVWLEFVPKEHIERILFYPDADKCGVTADIAVKGIGDYSLRIFFDGELVGEDSGRIEYGKKTEILLSEKHLWEEGKGNLYYVTVKFGKDEVRSYFGLRKVEYKGYDFCLNGKKVFQKFVLDQGYYPNGVYTPTDEEAFQKDIDLARELGFNGARLHQKVFDPIYLFLCDKAGYMVWGEFPGWGVDYSNIDSLGCFIKEWTEVLNRDFNHPSIITWCPLNEVWADIYHPQKKPDIRMVEYIYDFTKKFDATRPCVDVSGGYHCSRTDLYDFHSYRDYKDLDNTLSVLQSEGKLYEPYLYNEDADENLRYIKGLPVNVSEFGGIMLGRGVSVLPSSDAVESQTGWGYGDCEPDGDAFVEKYKNLVETIIKYSVISGFCYTQLYDIEQEQNGFYTYDRKDKLTKRQKSVIKEINSKR